MKTRKNKSIKKNKSSRIKKTQKGSSPSRKRQKTEKKTDETINMDKDTILYYELMKNINDNKINSIKKLNFEINFFIFNKKNTENNNTAKEYLDLLFKHIADDSGYNNYKNNSKFGSSLCVHEDFLSVYLENDNYKSIIEEDNSNIIIAVYNSLEHIYDTHVLGILHFTTQPDFIFQGVNKGIDIKYYGVYIDLICSFVKFYKKNTDGTIVKAYVQHQTIVNRVLSNLPEGETIAKLLFKATNNYLYKNIQLHYYEYDINNDKTVIGLDAIPGTNTLYKSLGAIFLPEEKKEYKDKHWIDICVNQNEENFHDVVNVNTYFVIENLINIDGVKV